MMVEETGRGTVSRSKTGDGHTLGRRVLAVAAALALAATIALVTGAEPAERVQAAPADDDFVPLVPARILDTRESVGAPQGPVGEGGVVDLQVTGEGGVPSSGVDSVVLNVTVTEPTASSFVTVWPTGEPRPEASSLNMVSGQTVPNLVIGKLGAGGRLSLYNAFGTTHLVADVMGWFPDGVNYQGSTPARILDTREGIGAPEQPVDEEGVIELQVAGEGGVPATGVGSVVLNVTVTEPTASSFVTVWPTGEPRPLASSLNMIPGDTRPNLVIAKLGDDGQVSLFNRFGSTHLVADVMGWFETDSLYNGEVPTRIIDTREAVGSVGAGEERSIDFSMLPDQASAVALNVTITEPTSSTFATVFPADANRPLASNLNALPGDTYPNLVVVKLSPDRKVKLYNAFGTAHFVVDLVGWIGAEVELAIDPGLQPIESFLDSPNRPLARLAGDGAVADFVGNELMVMGSLATAEEIADDWSGTIISTIPGGGGMQPVHTVRFDVEQIEPPPLEQSWARLDADIGGDYAVSDADASVLFALAVHLLAEGYDVSINVVVESTGYDDGDIKEQYWDRNGNGTQDTDESRNPYDWAYLRNGGNMDHGFTSAWSRLDAVGRLRPAVKVAIFDGGFADSADQENLTRVFNKSDEPNVASCGGSPCPWHGTGVADTVMATHDNRLGTAGGASPVVEETVALGIGRSWESYVRGFQRIIGGSLNGVTVVNISAGVGLPAIAWPFVAPILEFAAALVGGLGVQIVASAGNEGKNVDARRCFIACWEKTYWVPCELIGVMCVGGLRYDTSTHATNSNHGKKDVDIWSSYTVNVGPAPNKNARQRTVNGTSFSAPLVTAAIALVKAANPSLSGTKAAKIVEDEARRQSGEQRAKVVLDVQRAVDEALRQVGRGVVITEPTESRTYTYAAERTFEARWCCSGLAPSTYTWQERRAANNTSFTTIATGRTPTLRLTQGTGLRQIRVIARWADGTSRSDTVEIDVSNTAPTVSIESPSDGAEFFESSTIPLRANAFDPGGWNDDIPVGNMTWFVNGPVHDNGKQSSLSGLSPGEYTITFSADDGNRNASDTVTITVVADPPNPPPSVSLDQPIVGVGPGPGGPEWTYVGGPNAGFLVDGIATATDPENEALTVTFYKTYDPANSSSEEVLGVATRVGSTDQYVLEDMFFAIDPPGACESGTPYEVIVRASDGTTTAIDTAFISFLLIC